MADYQKLYAKLFNAATDALDALETGTFACDRERLAALEKGSPRAFGIGTYRFRQSRNSI